MSTRTLPSASLPPQVQQLISNILDAFITSSQVHYMWNPKCQRLRIALSTVVVLVMHLWVVGAMIERLTRLHADVVQKSKKGARLVILSATTIAMGRLALRKSSLLSRVAGSCEF